MTNEELVEQIQQGINVQDNLTALYEQNWKFICKMVKPFEKYSDIDDLQQEGWIGFQSAIDNFHSDSEYKFTTYSAWKIRKQCIDYIQKGKTKNLPLYMQQLIFKFNKFVAEYMSDHDDPPSDERIMMELQISQVKLDRIKKAIREQYCICIDDAIPGTDNLIVGDTIEDPTVDVEGEVLERAFQEHERKVLDHAIGSLTEQQGNVIRCRYFENCTQTEIARQMKVSSSRIQQVEQAALHRMQKMDELQELIDEKYGYDSKYAFTSRNPTEQLALKRIAIEERQNRLQRDIDKKFADLLEG